MCWKAHWHTKIFRSAKVPKRENRFMPTGCEHLEGLTEYDFPPLKTPIACEDCLVEGTLWVALRECRTCGHVGCCDSSPGTHATRHFHETRHPVMRAVPPAVWTWCYVHEAMSRLDAKPTDGRASMEFTTIAGTTLRASRIGLGTWSIGGSGWGGSDEGEAVRTIHIALDCGINLIDTAPVYGFGRR